MNPANRNNSSLIKNDREESLLDLEQKKDFVQAELLELRKEYQQQIRLIIQSVEKREREADEEINDLKYSIEDVSKRLIVVEQELDQTMKQVETIEKATRTIYQGLQSLDKSLRSEFEVMNLKITKFEEVSQMQNQSINQVIESIRENNNNQKDIKDGQKMLFQTQEKFIGNLWKAFFTILTAITAAGTGIGAIILNILDR